MKDLKLSLGEKNIKLTTQSRFVGRCNMLNAEFKLYIFPLILKKYTGCNNSQAERDV